MIEVPQNVCVSKEGLLQWSPVPFADGYNVHIRQDYIASLSGELNTKYQIENYDSALDYKVSAWVRNKVNSSQAHTSKSQRAGEAYEPEGQLIVDERFADLNDWLPKFPYWPTTEIINKELSYYSEAALHLTDEGLLIEAVKENIEGSKTPWRSGIVTGRIDKGFIRGYFEAEIQFDIAQGLWPAFWLLNVKYVHKRPEIDIMEMVGGELHQSYHWWEPHRNHNNNDFRLPAESGFHKYGLLWEESRLTWYYDRMPIYTVWGDHVPDQECYPIFNLAVGGTWPGAPSPELQRAEMKVKHFKVWQ